MLILYLPSQTAVRSVQPFLHSRYRVLLISFFYIALPHPFSAKFASYRAGAGAASSTWFLGPTRPTMNHKQLRNPVSRFSTTHSRYSLAYQRKERATERGL